MQKETKNFAMVKKKNVGQLEEERKGSTTATTMAFNNEVGLLLSITLGIQG